VANKQTYPNALSPLNGDVESTIGSSTATVTGIQTQPVAPTVPQPQQILVYGSDGIWHPEDPVVSGPDAPGNPSTANPVQVGGIDEGNLVREFRTDTDGSLRLHGVEQRLDILIQEIRAMKTAIISLDNTLNSSDFEAGSYSDLTTSETALP
jgi:hypothetical protein